MNTKYKKAFADLINKPGRSLFVILALTMGIWGVGTILVSYTILKNDLNENFLRTRPAHAVLSSKDFNKLNLEEFRKKREIESAEFRDFSLQRIEILPDKWIPLWLYGVKDFNNFHLAEIFHQKGAQVPPKGSILVERNGTLISDIRIGSKPRIRVGGELLKVPVSGIAYDPAQAPATQDAFIYAYTDMKTYRMITGERSDKRLIFRYARAAGNEQVRLMTKQVIREMENRGIRIESANIPRYNEHPHQWQLNTILSINGIIGFLAFLMGMVLVSQLMGSVLAQQVRQIGIMKAIGGKRSDIYKIYLTVVLIFGIIAGVIAVPLSVVSGYAFAYFVSGILNFDIVTASLPVHVYFIFMIIVLLLPVILSFPAIRRGVRVTVLEAISDYGTPQAALKTEKVSSRKDLFSNSTRLALRNLLRRKKRVMVTVTTMSLGVAIFSTGFNVRAALAGFLFDSSDSLRYDIQVVLKEQVPREKALLPFRKIKKIKSRETWNGGIGRLQTRVISAGNGMGLVALPSDTGLIKWNVIEGRWLQKSGENEFVLNQKAAELFGDLSVGNIYPIKLEDKTVECRLVGIIKEFNPAKLYMDKEKYDELVNSRHLVNSIMFSAVDRDYKKVMELQKEIERAVMSSDLSVLYVMSQAERSLIIFNHLNIILSILILLSLLVLIVSAMGMASAMGINIMERTREIGILRAIGATPGRIYRLFVTEGMFLSIISIFLGILTALPLSYLASLFFGNLILGENTSLDFTFSYRGFFITLSVTLLFGWLASRIPAGRAVSVSTREALIYE